MTNEAEWSEVFEHDGKQNPGLVGRFVEAQSANGYTQQGILERPAMFPRPGFCSAWIWGGLSRRQYLRRVVRYRIRRPRAMAEMDEILRQAGQDSPQSAPEPMRVPERVDT